MPSLAAPSPDPDKDNPVKDAIRDVIDSGGGGVHDIAVPTQLFAKHFDDAGGIAAAIGEKRPASPRKTPTVAATSLPAKKKTNTSSSPTRNAFTAVARVAAAAAAAIGVGGSSDIALPPAITRDRTSPTSIAGLEPP